ncbi:MAG: hypothetical protein JXO51_05260 [Candidatus Aminicenantes bacterium]|nr:hypothetical protein [Candidatus Aminicenantes bacterium]
MVRPKGTTGECLAIAGLVIKVKASPGLNFHRDKRFLPFSRNAARHDLVWNFQVIREGFAKTGWDVPGQGIPSRTELPDEARCPLLYSPQVLASLEGLHSRSERVVIEAHPEAVVILDFEENRAEIHLAQAHVAESAKRILSSALLAPFLPGFDALMFHAAAVVRDGKAAVFLAPDAGGKTTAALLSPSGTILGDDQVIVRRRRGRFRAWGTPWGLHVDAKVSAPLGGFFLLQKAKRFALKPLPARELVPCIWQEIRDSLSILTKPLKKKAFAVLCDIVAAAPAWMLSFPKNHIDWDEIDEVLGTRPRTSC